MAEQGAGGLFRLHEQVEAHHGGHYAAGESQKQADGAVGFAFEQRTHYTANASAAGAGKQRNYGHQTKTDR